MRIVRFVDREGRAGLATESAGAYRRLRGSLFGGDLEETGESVEPVRLLAPLLPRQLYCIGLNYREHAAETGQPIPEHPVVFMKSVGAVCGPEDAILCPEGGYSEQVDYECELAVVIGQDCRDATEETALDYVLGYTCANDVSARDWQKLHSGGQWCRAKSFDTFCPLGPALVTRDELGDAGGLAIRTRLNGSVVQESTTDDMIFRIPQLIAFLSRSATLPAGSAILTGTPPGVGMARQPPVYLRPGDRVEVEIEGIGVLANPVA